MNSEIEEGNIEYKRKLLPDVLINGKCDCLITQMKWRISEGNGVAVYYLGVNDNGSIYTFKNNEEQDTIDVFNIIIIKANLVIEKTEKLIFKDEHDIKNYYKFVIRNKIKYLDNYLFLIKGSKREEFLSMLLHGNKNTKFYRHKHEYFNNCISSIIIKYVGLKNNKILDCSSIVDDNFILENSDVILNFILVPESREIPKEFYDICHDVLNTESCDKNLFLENIKNYNLSIKNDVALMDVIYTLEDIHILVCYIYSGEIKVNNELFNEEFNIKALIKNIRYFHHDLENIDKKFIVVTMLVKSDNNMKKMRGKFFTII